MYYLSDILWIKQSPQIRRQALRQLPGRSSASFLDHAQESAVGVIDARAWGAHKVATCDVSSETVHRTYRMPDARHTCHEYRKMRGQQESGSGECLR